MSRILEKVRGHLHLLGELKASAGISAVVRWEALRLAVNLGRPEPATWRLRPRRVAYPVRMRLGGSSDMKLYGQIFVMEEYSCLRDLKDPAIVLDLGANVGFSSAYFLSVFPKSRVVAVEPDDRNIAMARANLAPYGDRALVLHGAAWSSSTTLRLSMGVFGDGREWATQVEELPAGDASEGGVQAWDVGTLIDITGASTVDLLKVDIEKAELSVFGESSRLWLHRVRNICIELHGKDCEAVFFAALANFDYELGSSGELTICRNLRPKVAAPPQA